MQWQSLTPELNPNDQIQFASFHRVGLEAGDYTIEAAQIATISGITKWFPSSVQNFSVRGERFQLNPQTLHSKFPPGNSRGNFWNVLPHVVLERSTLPWERTSIADAGQPSIDPPWLALLIFHGDEAPAENPATTTDNTLSTVTLADLEASSDNAPIWNGITLEYGETSTDQVKVVDVQAQTLLRQLPTAPEFTYQNHVRRRLAWLDPSSTDPTIVQAIANLTEWEADSDAELPVSVQKTVVDSATHYLDLTTKVEYIVLDSNMYQVATETAGVLANRLPMPGERNVVHLVSLEGMYDFTQTVDSLSVTVSNDASSNTTVPTGTSTLPDLATPGLVRLNLGESESQVVLVQSATSSSLTLSSANPIKFSGMVTSIDYTPEASWSGESSDSTTLYRFVSLANWEFFCQDPQRDFQNILLGLNGTRTIAISDGALTPTNLAQKSYLTGTNGYSLTIAQTPYLQVQSDGTAIGAIVPSVGADWSTTANIVSGQVVDSSSIVVPTANGTITDYATSTSIGVTNGVLDSSAAGDWFGSDTLSGSTATNEITNSDSTVVGRLLTSSGWSGGSAPSTFSITGGTVSSQSNLNGLILDVTEATGSALVPPIPASASGNTAAEFLQAGFVPLRHSFRQGDQSVSWYHGPLLPHADAEESVAAAVTDGTPAHVTAPEVTLPASNVDSLLLFDSVYGMFDVSWAAAWELGRLLTLQNTRIATQFFQWKRDRVHSMNTARYLADYGYQLPQTVPSTGIDPGLPASFGQWLNELTVLDHVPFNYLVPNPDMLPPESLRFFTVDRLWLECLRDGAFSVGRVLSADAGRDREPLSQLPNIPVLSGLLLRSEVVTGWGKKLNITGYSTPVPVSGSTRDDASLSATSYPVTPLLRLEQLSPSVMIAIFEGDVQMADIHVIAEQLHFGFDIPPGLATSFDPASSTATNSLVKNLRNGSGELVTGTTLTNTQVSDVVDATSRTVTWSTLASDLVTALASTPGFQPTVPPAQPPEGVLSMTSAIFALEMVAGVEAVRFVRRPYTGS